MKPRCPYGARTQAMDLLDSDIADASGDAMYATVLLHCIKLFFHVLSDSYVESESECRLFSDFAGITRSSFFNLFLNLFNIKITMSMSLNLDAIDFAGTTT